MRADFSHNFAGISDSYDVSGDILSNYASCSDDRIISDSNTGNNNGSIALIPIQIFNKLCD